MAGIRSYSTNAGDSLSALVCSHQIRNYVSRSHFAHRIARAITNGKSTINTILLAVSLNQFIFDFLLHLIYCRVAIESKGVSLHNSNFKPGGSKNG